MYKVGILGGSFNPPTLGHIALAKLAYEQLGLSELVIVPNYRNPLKTEKKGIDDSIRLNMVYDFSHHLDSLGIRNAVIDFEISRDLPSYMIYTLQRLSEIFPSAELSFICGDDVVARLTEWKNPERLHEYCSFAIAPREDLEEERIRQILQTYNIESTFLEGELPSVSSSLIRELADKGDKAYYAYTITKIARAIEEKSLYLNMYEEIIPSTEPIEIWYTSDLDYTDFKDATWGKIRPKLDK